MSYPCLYGQHTSVLHNLRLTTGRNVKIIGGKLEFSARLADFSVHHIPNFLQGQFPSGTLVLGTRLRAMVLVLVAVCRKHARRGTLKLQDWTLQDWTMTDRLGMGGHWRT